MDEREALGRMGNATPLSRLYLSENARIVTCQSQDGHALKHTMLYCLINLKWDYDLRNYHHAVLKDFN